MVCTKGAAAAAYEKGLKASKGLLVTIIALSISSNAFNATAICSESPAKY